MGNERQQGREQAYILQYGEGVSCNIFARVPLHVPAQTPGKSRGFQQRARRAAGKALLRLGALFSEQPARPLQPGGDAAEAGLRTGLKRICPFRACARRALYVRLCLCAQALSARPSQFCSAPPGTSSCCRVCQPSTAHFTRAGICEISCRAAASSSSSSCCGAACP